MRSDNPTNNQPSKNMTTNNEKPAASDLSASAGYKYTVETYVVAGLIEMRDNFKGQRKWRQVDDLNDLIDRMYKGENILL